MIDTLEAAQEIAYRYRNDDFQKYYPDDALVVAHIETRDYG